MLKPTGSEGYSWVDSVLDFHAIGPDFASSYPQPPNLCTEGMIDHAGRTWILTN